MKRPFSFIGAAEQDLPTHNLESLLERYLNDALTGLVEFSGGGEHLITLLIAGTPILSCRMQELRCERIANTGLATGLPTTRCRIRTSILPTEAVHIAKAMLEWGPPVEIFTAKTSALPELIHQWSSQSQSQVIHILWESAEGYLRFAGATSPSNTFYLTTGQLRTEQDGLTTILNHPETSCVVMRYTTVQQEHTQEQLISLQQAFGALVNMLVTRYANLVGRGLSNTLMLEFNAIAIKNTWQIRLTTAGVTNTQQFTNPLSAQQSYQLLLQELRNHMSLVVGARLVETLTREALIDLAPEAQQTLRQYPLAN